MMLCTPTTITLRRPSADADLVISRLEAVRARSSKTSTIVSASCVSSRESSRWNDINTVDCEYIGVHSPSLCCPWSVPPTSSSSAPASRRSSPNRQSHQSESANDSKSPTRPGQFCSASYPSTPVDSPSAPRSPVGQQRSRSGGRGRRGSGSPVRSGCGSPGSVGRAAARIGSGIRRARNGLLDSLDCLLVHLLESRENDDHSNWVIQVSTGDLRCVYDTQLELENDP